MTRLPLDPTLLQRWKRLWNLSAEKTPECVRIVAPPFRGKQLFGRLLSSRGHTLPMRATKCARPRLCCSPDYMSKRSQGAGELDLTAALCQRARMTIARISELDRKTTQSGKAIAGRWLLEFERSQPVKPDPLTGWNGSGDTKPQVRLNFASKEA